MNAELGRLQRDNANMVTEKATADADAATASSNAAAVLVAIQQLESAISDLELEKINTRDYEIHWTEGWLIKHDKSKTVSREHQVCLFLMALLCVIACSA